MTALVKSILSRHRQAVSSCLQSASHEGRNKTDYLRLPGRCLRTDYLRLPGRRLRFHGHHYWQSRRCTCSGYPTDWRSHQGLLTLRSGSYSLELLPNQADTGFQLYSREEPMTEATGFQQSVRLF